MENKFKYKINLILVLLSIFIISSLNMISPKDQTISEEENRALAKKPEFSSQSLFTGKYIRDFESYFADHFLYREYLVKYSKKISTLKGIKRSEDVHLVEFAGQNVGGENNGGNEQANSNGNLLILNDTVMELYKFNEKTSKSYADMINKLQEQLGNNTKVYSILAPLQIEFLTVEKYKNLSDSQIDAINYVKSNLSDKIITVDVYNPIKEHINEYVYFRTDHHWTALGAYYGYTGFAKVAGFDAISLDKYEKEEAKGFLGHLSTVNPTDAVTNNPDDVIFYNPLVKNSLKVHFYDKETNEKKTYEGKVISKSYIDKDQKYGIFMGGDFPLGIIKTDVKNEKKIMVIKDSYANAFLPFLLPHYSEIYVVDPRHYKENIIDLVKENNIGEVLILNYIKTTNFDSYINSVVNLMK